MRLEKYLRMVDHFERRTREHIVRVQSNALRLGIRGVIEQSNLHDLSKYEEPEYTPYLHISWRYRMKDMGREYVVDKDMEDRMYEATMHHIKSNKHHPEYWSDEVYLNREDRNKASERIVDATGMDDVSIGEMVCDWVAMSQEKQNVNDASKWIADNVNVRWKFDDRQVRLIEEYHKKLQ